MFVTFPSTNLTDISPFTYTPKNDVIEFIIQFNELLKKNYMKGKIGKFGSTVERFINSSV